MGNVDEIVSLIVASESKMYADKAQFHKEYPQYSRK